MSIIGNFKKISDGYDGRIVMLALNAKVKLVSNEKKSESSPDFRIVTARARSARPGSSHRRGRSLPPLGLPRRSLVRPINAGLFEADGQTFHLVWSRRKDA